MIRSSLVWVPVRLIQEWVIDKGGYWGVKVRESGGVWMLYPHELKFFSKVEHPDLLLWT